MISAFSDIIPILPAPHSLFHPDLLPSGDVGACAAPKVRKARVVCMGPYRLYVREGGGDAGNEVAY